MESLHDNDNMDDENATIRCSKCGKIISFKESHRVENKDYIGENEKTISSGFPTGVTVKQRQRIYQVYETRLCDNCYYEYLTNQRKHKIWMTLLYVLIFVVFAAIVFLAYKGYISEGVMFVAGIPFVLFILYLLRK